MDIKEIQTYLDTNKDSEEVKSFMNSFKVAPTLEVFKEKAGTDKEFKAFLDSEKDKHAAKSLETWKTNNLQKLIDEEVQKRNPAADPKDAKIKELELKFESMQKEALKKELTNKALKFAQEKKLPADLIDYFVSNDEETTNKNLNKLNEVFLKYGEQIKTEFAKTNSYMPPADKTDLDAKKKMAEEVSKYFK